MLENDLKKIINENYLINIIKIEKNEESTVGNVYIIHTELKKYVAKIYDDLNHVNSMINLHSDLNDKFNIPKIIQSKNKSGYVNIKKSKYIVLYSFIDGIQIGKKFNKLPQEIIRNIALELRKLHDLTSKLNKYNLNEVSFCKNYNIKRSSLLHFDLTKSNIFYNEKDGIGIIDFDDAKYGISVCDVAIIISLLFFSKNRGVDMNSLNIFIDTYYGKDLELKLEEIKYIKEIAINWIDYVLSGNEFDTSLKESFEIKKKLIEQYM